ncbi:glycerate kinase [Thermosediminibacter oceani]|uniref:Glycerate kinase n=1 Tax=Thermosediminibacter oceani (strain ATCC BAA-1034 / DSM 16646 / JW/IW-1228P) TaxID=555079 RepID=D9S1Z1_THEOJ|nr:glycerate kinase [Thermosediminibacter oceani]ADL07418.1 glycerate kinase [Thermosediminibacter oceani DSM 16646]
MKVLIAPDSFKGSLTSLQAANAMERGVLKAAFSANAVVEVYKIPMADGGEGTVEAVICAAGGRIVKTRVLDPLGRTINSFFGVLSDGTAVIEMAAASGLNLLKPGERNPMVTTTYGTGQLIRSALDHGCRKLIIGIGGSATNDGGVGMAQALGVKFLDAEGKNIGFGGGELSKIERIDISGLDPRVKGADIVVACDVKNVLCGPQGASAVYGPQKGATPEMVEILDENLRHLAEVIKVDLGKDIAEVPGSGAAGGLGAALMAFLNSKLRPGIEIMMDITHFSDRVSNANLIITGEGCTDYQTLFGKVPFGIGQVAKRFNKPVICISGSLGEDYEQLYDAGITALFSIINRPMTLEEAMERGEELLEKVSENVFRLYLSREVR